MILYIGCVFTGDLHLKRQERKTAYLIILLKTPLLPINRYEDGPYAKLPEALTSVGISSLPFKASDTSNLARLPIAFLSALTHLDIVARLETLSLASLRVVMPPDKDAIITCSFSANLSIFCLCKPRSGQVNQ